MAGTTTKNDTKDMAGWHGDNQDQLKTSDAVNVEAEEQDTDSENDEGGCVESKTEVSDAQTTSDICSDLRKANKDLTESLAALEAEKADIEKTLRKTTRALKQAEAADEEANDKVDELTENLTSTRKATRKLKGDMKAMQDEIKEMVSQLNAAVKELEAEKQNHAETAKNLRKANRRIKEFTAQAEENSAELERLQDLVGKLQKQIRQYKRHVDEAGTDDSDSMPAKRQSRRYSSRAYYAPSDDWDIIRDDR